MPSARQLSVGANGNDFGLTPLEKRVIALVFAGYTSKESGQRIGVSMQSVRRHLRDIMSKLGVSSRLELVLFTAYYHLIDPSQIPLVSLKGVPARRPPKLGGKTVNSSLARGTWL